MAQVGRWGERAVADRVNRRQWSLPLADRVLLVATYYLGRAADQYGQVIHVLLSEHRDTTAARRFLPAPYGAGRRPSR